MNLGFETKKCQISLATITNVMENCGIAIAGLEIMDLNSTAPIDLHKFCCQEAENFQECSSNSRRCQTMALSGWPGISNKT